jgi:RNA-directed DNA polymerase
VYRAHVVNYADDFVILSRGHADEALAWTRRVMTRLGLTVNEAKTTVRNARQERFDFLGYSFGPHHYRKDGHWYLGASPSRKSVQRLKDLRRIKCVTAVVDWGQSCNSTRREIRRA